MIKGKTLDRPLFHAAVRYAGSGLSVIPTGSARHVDEARRKKAVVTWKPYQDRIAKPEEISRLFRDESQLAIALISGSVSGNLEVIDFDKPELFPSFMESLLEHSPVLTERLIMQKTPSGGFHLLYRCKDPVPGNQKLAMSRRYQDKEGKPRQDVYIETRGEGGYFLVAPSEGYHLQGDIKDIPIIGGDERALLIGIAKGFDEGSEPERQLKLEPSGQAGDRPGDIFERVADWRTLLEADGWRYLKTIGDREHWSRPGKDPASSSATLNEKGLYVFSSNTPLPTGTPLGKFTYIANIRFSSDFKAAAKWVVETYPEEFPKNTSRNRMTDREKPPPPDDSDISKQFRTNTDTPDSSGHSGQAPDKIRTTSGQVPDNGRTIAGDVLSFIDMDPVPFTNNDLYSELCIHDRRGKKRVSDALCYYEKQGKIKKIEGKRGSWEIVEDKPKTMDLLSVDTEPFKITLPLEISDYVNVRPGGIILVSGSNNAGKTVFLLSVVRKFLSGTHIKNSLNLSFENCERFTPIIYLNSEMSPQELVARIRSFGDDPAGWVKHVSFIERSHSFDRVVAPDGINLIDFLEVNEDFFQAGKLIADIHKKLNSGIAIIAMQKKQGYAFAKGGEMTLEKPRLAINLDKNEPHGFTCKISKSKEAVDFTRNIQGMTRDFVITGDSKILPTSDWRHVNEKQRYAINAEYDRNNLPRRVLESGQHYKVV